MKFAMVVIGLIGWFAATRAVIGLLFNGSRDEFVGVSAIVALICFGILLMFFGLH